jgi:hypothetical protein
MQVYHKGNLSEICQLIFYVPSRSVRRPVELLLNTVDLSDEIVSLGFAGLELCVRLQFTGSTSDDTTLLDRLGDRISRIRH